MFLGVTVQVGTIFLGESFSDSGVHVNHVGALLGVKILVPTFMMVYIRSSGVQPRNWPFGISPSGDPSAGYCGPGICTRQDLEVILMLIICKITAIGITCNYQVEWQCQKPQNNWE